jgi:hypothetical protein
MGRHASPSPDRRQDATQVDVKAVTLGCACAPGRSRYRAPLGSQQRMKVIEDHLHPLPLAVLAL